MFCHKCGSLLSDEAKFCHKCGERVLVLTPDEILNTAMADSVKLIVISAGVENEIFSDLTFDISVDGVPMGNVPGKGTIEYEITPGQHCIKIGTANIVMEVPKENESVTLVFIWGPNIEQKIVYQQDQCATDSQDSNSNVVQNVSNKKLKAFFWGVSLIITACVVIIIAVVIINTINLRHKDDILSVADYSQREDFDENNTLLNEDVSGQDDIGMNEDVRRAYAEKVQELAAQDDTLLFDLIDVDGNNVLELVADQRGYEVSLFTWADGKNITLMDKWIYGVGGNAGYSYQPGRNIIYNYDMEDAGAIIIENLWAINRYYEVTGLSGGTLCICHFNDINRNQRRDEGEEYCDEPFYYWGDTEITKEEYMAFQVEGNAELISGDKTAEEILKLLHAEN